MELTRKQESLIRSLYTRHGRRKAGLCVCEGLRAAGELFMRAPELVRFTVATEAAAGELAIPGELHRVPEGKLRELAGTVNSQGILAVAAIPPEPDAAEAPADPFLLAIDRLGDPGNFGTICRTLRAAGLTELWYTKGSVDPYGDQGDPLGARRAVRAEAPRLRRPRGAAGGRTIVRLPVRLADRSARRGELFLRRETVRAQRDRDRRRSERRDSACGSAAGHDSDAGQLRIAECGAGRHDFSV